MADDEDWRAVNRANWDERVAIHLGAPSYDLGALRAGRLAEAEMALSRSLELDGKQPLVLAERSEALARQGKLKPALADLDSAIVLSPKDPSHYLARGYILCDLRRYQDALADLDRSLGLRPNYALAHCARALAKAELRDFRGAMGLEAAYDHELRGQAGARSILVNSAGYRHRRGQELIAAPVPGLNLYTTLDMDLQRAAEKALDSVNGDERGAVVVMNPSNGDILAIASAPAFDPGEFVDGLSPNRWTNFFLAEPATPLMNRATYGQYAPGSTFKIIDGLAMLENGLDPDASFTVEPDPVRVGRGAFYLGRRKIEDTAPPGEYDFHRAFIRSSNSYFIFHGLRLGWERLTSTGLEFGLGQHTGIRIPEESPGFFPNMTGVHERGWSQGNLANVSIGQEITLTPLQLAVAVSAVANGGKVFWPRLVDRLVPEDPLSETPPIRVKPGQVRSEVKFKAAHFQRMRSVMRDDVLDNEGTGKAARVADFAVCGKTGTAEIKGNGRKDKVTWFASFAPYEAPRYVVIVMVESGGSGGGTCAPVARQIYEFLHNRERASGSALAANLP